MLAPQHSYYDKDKKNGKGNGISEGEKRKANLLTQGVVLAELELDKRRGNVKSGYSKTVGMGYPLTELSIEYMDPLFAKKGEKDSPPEVLGHCNGVLLSDYETPLDYMARHYFAGVADKQYTGDPRDTAITSYIGGAINLEFYTDVSTNTRLCCIPDVDEMHITGGTVDPREPEMSIPNLLVWPTNRKVGFRWVPVDKLKMAFERVSTTLLAKVEIDLKDVLTHLKKGEKEARDFVHGKVEAAEKVADTKFGNTEMAETILLHSIYQTLFFNTKSRIEIDAKADFGKVRNAITMLLEFEGPDLASKGDSDLLKTLYEQHKKYCNRVEAFINGIALARTLEGCTGKGRVYTLLLQK